MSFHGNNGIQTNIKYRKTAYAENIKKRLESQVKHHRITTEVHKIISFTHTKVSTFAIFCDPRQYSVDPRDSHDLCQSLTHATLDPSTHTTQATLLSSRLVKLM